MTNSCESNIEYVPYKKVIKKGRWNIITLIKKQKVKREKRNINNYHLKIKKSC